MFTFKQNYIKYNIKYYEMTATNFIQHVVPPPQRNF